MKQKCMKCMISTYPVHDVCCIHDPDPIVNNVVARNAAKFITVVTLQDLVWKIVDLYNLTKGDYNDFDFERFLTERDTFAFNRAMRYRFDDRLNRNIRLE